VRPGHIQPFFADRFGFADIAAFALVALVAVAFFATGFASFAFPVFFVAAAFRTGNVEVLEDFFGLFLGVLLGIMSPTTWTALEPASITTSAADVAASPIRSSTPFDFFLVAI
jgi:hypothetical protein